MCAAVSVLTQPAVQGFAPLRRARWPAWIVITLPFSHTNVSSARARSTSDPAQSARAVTAKTHRIFIQLAPTKLVQLNRNDAIVYKRFRIADRRGNRRINAPVHFGVR